jgi:hypothetical protein
LDRRLGGFQSRSGRGGEEKEGMIVTKKTLMKGNTERKDDVKEGQAYGKRNT